LSLTSQEIVDSVTATFEELSRQTDLSPKNERVNHLLTNLVNLVTQVHDQAAVKTAMAKLEEKGIVTKLRELCQKAEFLLEGHYSQTIVASK
jgi:hypothetical protein